ncbi:hypothetical protein B0A49_07023 [Cryomyces minteri]|uniref:F-box domain-containing protein n=1 Tax=Cryomyces minteri TaxID=331657 RepID=A0A4U0WZM3_9PEZI|nr:hypothetical protein B0A49_07023 [Cryomyces minteri]
MYLGDLATELIEQIFISCTTVESVVALSSTCHRFHSIYSSRKLSVLANVAEAQYGPLHDITQLLTHNDSQFAHVPRSVPFSLALLAQIVRTGRVAVRWANIYPFKKWKLDSENRRLLTSTERYRVRRAIYRLWLFTAAFHTPYHPRHTRANPTMQHERTMLLHNCSTIQLAEMADMHAIMRDVVSSNVCPSNGTIARKFRKRFPDPADHQLVFNMNIHLNYPIAADHYTHARSWPAALLSSPFHAKYRATPHHEPGAEGWGDDIAHYYVVQDMLKLSLEQILWLKENAPYKGQVQAYVKELGDWFENNGETFGQTLELVICERDGGLEDAIGLFWDAVGCGRAGVTKDEEDEEWREEGEEW